MSPPDEDAAALRKAKRLIADYVNHICRQGVYQQGLDSGPGHVKER